MSNEDQAEALFKKIISKHNQLMEYEKSKTSSELISFIKELISDYSTILELSPREKNSRNNRGLVKVNLAELYMSLGKKDEAMDEFESAVGDFSMVLAYDNSYLMSYSNRATSNSNISKLYAKMDEDILALQYLRYVNDDYNSILKIDSTIEKIISEKASVTFDLGEAYALQEDISKSFNYFEESIYYHLKMLNSVSDEVEMPFYGIVL
jgi:tetratricopeptide (TPR) repeat protein